MEDSDHDILEEQQGRTLRDRAAIKQPERYEAEVAEIWEPSTYHEAMTCPDADLWKEAIREELQAHKKNGTWRLVAESEGNNIIDSKWVFRVKKNPSGQIDRYKARLCARGFLQRSGVDYAEIFSPVVRYDSLRIFLATAAQRDLEIAQFNVRTAFLYGRLQEDIYMRIPEGLIIPEESDSVVCKLERALYGLKQASRCWNKTFCEFLKSFKFKECDADNCVFRGSVDECEKFIYFCM